MARRHSSKTVVAPAPGEVHARRLHQDRGRLVRQRDQHPAQRLRLDHRHASKGVHLRLPGIVDPRSYLSERSLRRVRLAVQPSPSPHAGRRAGRESRRCRAGPRCGRREAHGRGRRPVGLRRRATSRTAAQRRAAPCPRPRRALRLRPRHHWPACPPRPPPSRALPAATVCSDTIRTSPSIGESLDSSVSIICRAWAAVTAS